MPKIIALGRKWNLSSDDLFLPALIESTIHLVRATLIVSFFIATKYCLEWDLYFSFNFLTLILLTTLNALVSIISLRGTVADDRPRKAIPKLAKYYLILNGLDVIILIYGLFIIYNQPNLCGKTSLLLYVWTSLAATSAFHVTLLLSIWDANLPIGDNQTEIDSSATWSKRLQWMFYAHTIKKNPNISEALNNVSKVLADFFDYDSNLVASDIAVAMVLLKRRQIWSEFCEAGLRSRVSPGLRNDRNPVKLADMEPVSYYFQYAEAIYGLPLFLFSKPFFKCVKQFCCPCFSPKKQSVSEYVSVKFAACCCFATWPPTCLIPNCGGTKTLPHPDLLYFSLHNEIFLSPFMVAVDRPKQSIIIAIRGSMSTSDIITDLAMQTVSLELEGNYTDTFTHGGMLSTARRILKELDSEGILTNLESNYANYQLVAVGHSLGAGVAALLTHLIRTSNFAIASSLFREAICFAYGPPAVIASPSTALYFETFCTSIVLGADIVCRLNRPSIHALQQDVLHLVSNCQERKIDVLGKAIRDWLLGCFGISKDFNVRILNNDEEIGERTPIALSPPTYDNLNDDGGITRSSRWRGFASDPEMTLPGKIIYFCSEGSSINSSTTLLGGGENKASNSKRVYRAVWASREEFKHVVISSSMLTDHLPHNLGMILRRVVEGVDEDGNLIPVSYG